MSRAAAEILEDALALPELERAQLAAALLASLDGEGDPDAETEWAAEIERRLARLVTAQSISMNESLVRLHQIARSK